MRSFLFLFIGFVCLIACTSCQRKKQWNLNSSVGWGSLDPNDLTVLVLKGRMMDSTGRVQLRKLDSIILEQLREGKLGVAGEKDTDEEIEYLYLVSKDFKSALNVIVFASKEAHTGIVVYKRTYLEDGTWTDEPLLY